VGEHHGRPAEEVVEDAIVGYFDEPAQVRDTLDTRYDDIKCGKVKMIPGEAYVDLHEIGQCIANDSPDAAERVVTAALASWRRFSGAGKINTAGSLRVLPSWATR
jgi:hypothetical protein